VSNCRGRHIQKLNDFLKDVFKEENRVHLVHGDDGWEESEEAWEVGEEEMMIVGTIQREDSFSIFTIAGSPAPRHLRHK
jgi:hypothetical protein